MKNELQYIKITNSFGKLIKIKIYAIITKANFEMKLIGRIGTIKRVETGHNNTTKWRFIQNPFCLYINPDDMIKIGEYIKKMR